MSAIDVLHEPTAVVINCEFDSKFQPHISYLMVLTVRISSGTAERISRQAHHCYAKKHLAW